MTSPPPTLTPATGDVDNSFERLRRLLTKIRWQSLATLVVVSGVLSPIVWNYVLKDYQKKRVTDFLNPDANLLGSGWHAHHARVAI